MIRFIKPITNAVSAFVVHDAPMPTHALHVTEGIPDVSAPSRHNDILTVSIRTPLRSQVFVRFLSSHPDQAFVLRLIHSLTNSFDIGYTGPHTRIFAHKLPSAYKHPTVVDNALSKEVAEHKIAGPFHSITYTVQESASSRKRTVDGNHRILSAPNGLSINDFIDLHDYYLQYTRVDDTIQGRIQGGVMGADDPPFGLKVIPSFRKNELLS